MSGFERIKEEKKARIRQAAFKLFTENGYKNVKISDIARAADVSQVTIYNHFENKEALFRDVMIRFMEDQYTRFQEVIESEQTFKEKMAYIFKEKIETATVLNPEIMQRILVDDPVLSDYLRRLGMEKGIPMTVHLIEEGKQLGEVNPQYSTESILIYLNMFELASEKYPEIFTGENRLSLMQDLLHLVFYGLLGKQKS
ncbi:MAG: TetR/AcrR family transcriptional regulator [Tuberibacillus sp.]